MATALAASEGLTLDQLKAVMPKRQRTNVTQGLVDDLNSVASDESFREFFRDNILGYVDVLQDPNSTLPGYIAAIKYCSYKMMDATNETAWKRTFPDRYQKLLADKRDAGYIRSVVCAYNRGKMVQQILKQAMIPIWLLNQDKVQDAIHVQCNLMAHAKSEKVRSDAANSILTHLKQPEVTKLELDVGVKDNDQLEDLKKTMVELAQLQQAHLRQGLTNVKTLGETPLIEGSASRVDEE